MYTYVNDIASLTEGQLMHSHTYPRTIIAIPALITALLLTILAPHNTQAALYDRGGGLIYDDVLDVTWLQDAAYAASTLTVERINQIVANNTLVFSDNHVLTDQDFFLTANTGGSSNPELMKWWGAMAWADQLEYYDPIRGVTYSDWRLPSVAPMAGVFDIAFSNNGTTDFGYGSLGIVSELNYMFYENLSGLGICTPNGSGSSTTCETQAGWGLGNTGPFNNIQTQTYWSNTELGAEVWAFDFGVGFQGLKTESNRNNQLHAWAVRDGDVAAVTPVPAPGAIGLFTSGFFSIYCFWVRRFGKKKS